MVITISEDFILRWKTNQLYNQLQQVEILGNAPLLENKDEDKSMFTDKTSEKINILTSESMFTDKTSEKINIPTPETSEKEDP